LIAADDEAKVARHRLLGGDHGRDLGVDPPLELVRLGIVPAHPVGEVHITLYERDTTACNSG